MENTVIRQLAEDFTPYIYLLIGMFVGLAIGVILYFVLNLKSPLMESITDDFAKDRPVTVFIGVANDDGTLGKKQIGHGIARSSKDGFVHVEMNSGHGEKVGIQLIRFDDAGKDD